MIVQRQESSLFVELEAYCGIACVEEHTETFKDVLCAEAGITNLCLECKNVEEFDTAYLQLLEVLRQHMKNHDGEFMMQNRPSCMTELMDCYGLRF